MAVARPLPPPELRTTGLALIQTGQALAYLVSSVLFALTGAIHAAAAGDVASQTVRTLAGNVECPAISPDRRRIVFKEAIGDHPGRGPAS